MFCMVEVVHLIITCQIRGISCILGLFWPIIPPGVTIQSVNLCFLSLYLEQYYLYSSLNAIMLMFYTVEVIKLIITCQIRGIFSILGLFWPIIPPGVTIQSVNLSVLSLYLEQYYLYSSLNAIMWMICTVEVIQLIISFKFEEFLAFWGYSDQLYPLVWPYRPLIPALNLFILNNTICTHL